MSSGKGNSLWINHVKNVRKQYYLKNGCHIPYAKALIMARESYYNMVPASCDTIEGQSLQQLSRTDFPVVDPGPSRGGYAPAAPASKPRKPRAPRAPKVVVPNHEINSPFYPEYQDIHQPQSSSPDIYNDPSNAVFAPAKPVRKYKAPPPKPSRASKPAPKAASGIFEFPPEFPVPARQSASYSKTFAPKGRSLSYLPNSMEINEPKPIPIHARFMELAAEASRASHGGSALDHPLDSETEHRLQGKVFDLLKDIMQYNPEEFSQIGKSQASAVKWFKSQMRTLRQFERMKGHSESSGSFPGT